MPTEFARCMECGHIAPSTMSGICEECKPNQMSDEDLDTEQYQDDSHFISGLFVSDALLPPGEDGQPIPGTYILCHGRKPVSDDPDLDKDWEAFGPPLSLSAQISQMGLYAERRTL